MGRPMYPHELSDPDFSWLINSFRENNPNCTVIESSCLPIVLIRDGAVPAPEQTIDTPPTPAAFDSEEADDGDGDVIGRK